MGLETGATWIDDLVPSNPVPGDSLGEADNHLNLIKQVLQNQFTSLGGAAVTVTAAELNDVPNKLVSFNGRTATAAVPTDGDYSLAGLSDTDTSGVQAGKRLVYRGSEWIDDRTEVSVGDYRATSLVIGNGNRIRVATTDNDGSMLTADGFTVNYLNISPNNSAGFQAVGQGGGNSWFDIHVSIIGQQLSDAASATLLISKNGTDTAAITDSTVIALDSGTGEAGQYLGLSCSATMGIIDTDEVYIHWITHAGNPEVNRVQVTTRVRER